MRTPRIYTPQDLQENTTIELVESVAHYMTTVLRMKLGRELILFNGQGGEYKTTLASINKKQVCVDVAAFDNINPESPLNIELGICLIKNDPMDWLIQKATELGVVAISPLLSEFTDFKLSESRYPKKIKHWQQVVVNACQQCGRTRLPVVHQPKTLSVWAEQVQADAKWVLHPHHQSEVLSSGPGAVSAALLIGPEGGLAEQEFTQLCDLGFTAVGLGPRILRAETAAVSGLTLMQHYLGDLSQ